jgi:predicted metal-dependent phosphoesterase TrpH
MAVDLHIHSNASDGSLSPEAIVEEAKRLGLTAIAIADHDVMSGVGPACRRGEAAGLPVIPAVEISTDYGETEVHILGYWIDPGDPQLEDQLRHIREGRLLRAGRMVDHLQKLGVRIELGDVLREAHGASVGRPHVAAALVRAGACETPREAFDRFIGKRGPAYVPRIRPSVAEAVQIVARAGGCPVLAHPGLVFGHPRIVHEMARLGARGVEAYHPKHTPGAVETLVRVARSLGLLVTGGSDSHGEGGSDPVPIGAANAPDSCAVELKEWRRQRDV